MPPARKHAKTNREPSHFAVTRVRSPDELLRELEALPRDTVYEDPDEWIFRGVGSSAHALLPSALRPKTYLGLGGKLKQVRNWTAREAVLAEASMLQMYLQSLQRTGLTVPGGDEACRLALRRVLRETLPPPRRPSAKEDRQDSASWPDDALLPLLGLAQHHGLPTRLLDFTWDSRIAAYFAATDALRGSARSFSVWAVHAARLNMDVEIRTHIMEGGASTTDPGARVVFVDSSLNPRLRAQRGLFLVASAYRQPLPEEGRAIKWKPIERLQVPAFEPESLRRFDMDRRHAPALLAHLARVGIDGGTIYPDHAGAWTSVQERLQLGKRSLQNYKTFERRLLRLWSTQA